VLALLIMTLSPAKQELLRRLRAEAGPRRLADEPIAVLGLAVRLPGTSGNSFWRLLADGVDAIGEVPPGRWPAPERSERRFGGFLDQVDQFDAGLFAISPREAATMDPQHRLLLETCWSAFEHAGLGRATLAGSATGVFLAVYQRDYAKLATADPARIDAYTASGTHHSMAAGRLAYSFDLRGPALVVDTACSSSLVALHLACRSLLAGESRIALVGAANLMLAPEESVALSRWGMLAPDGRCKPFDARADGFVRGEGVVALVLARQRDVLCSGRRIRALVLGTAVNQDGHSNGLTAPNAAAQRAVIRTALEDADLSASRVGYVEAHGTGTALGDPIEMQALIAEYGAASDAEPICVVGSVKSNIGHLEASAGLAGVAKAIACLEHGQIPATLHFRQLNPAIDLRETRIEIAAAQREWSSAGPRHAAVSSFGMGGTNAHVILGQAAIPTTETVSERSAFVLPISAHDGTGLSELIAAHREALASKPDLQAWCASAARGRTHHAGHRVAVVGSSAAELAEALAERSGTPRSGRAPRGVVFCCPGQGGQWLGMGRGLLAREPVFEQALAQCDAAIRAVANWSVIDRLRAPTISLERIDVVQPLLFALAIAYAALWRSWGIEPDAVVGHSMGEIAAAHLSGRLSLADAALVIVRRSELMHGLPGGGSMLAVDLSADHLVASGLLATYPSLSIAAENGPSALVVAGARAQIEALAAELDARGVRWRSIAVEVASHSPAVEVLDGPLAVALVGLAPQPGTLAMYSTVEGRRLADHEQLDADYWRRNLRQRVKLWPAIQAAAADAHELFIELGPHPVLLPAVREGLDALRVRGLTVASGRRDTDEQLELCRSLASLYEAGLELDWDACYAGARLDAALPGYPFQRSAYWLPRSPAVVSGRAHPFLGERIELAHEGGETEVWTGCVTLDRAAFLRDHLVEGSCVLPGMGSVDLVLAALAESGRDTHELRELTFERAIVLHEDEAIELQLRIDRAGSFEIWGRSDAGDWTRRVHGRVAALREPGPTVDLVALRERCRPTHDRAAFYSRLNRTGNLWGPAFAGVEAIARDGDELLVDLALPPSIVGELWRHRFHPALLDACAQGLLSVDLERERGSLVLAEIGRVAVHGAAERAHASWIRVDAQQQHGSLRGDVIVVDETGARVLEIEGLRVQFLHERQAGGWFHASSWRAIARAQPSGPSARRFVFVGGTPELERATVECLVAHGLAQDGEATDLVHIVEPAPADTSAAAQLDATVHACLAAITSSSSNRRMWLVTRGGAPVDGRCDPVQSAVWGLGRVMQVELGRRFARAIDLDPDETATLTQLAHSLAEELLSEDAEQQLAYRDGRRLAARLEARAPIPIPGRTSPLARLDPGAGVLITGGLGGLGLRMAEDLLGRGARRLILLGRTPLPDRSQWSALELDSPTRQQVEAVRALEARGAEVHVVALDIGDEPALHGWATRWSSEGRPPIRVVVHAAGVQHPRALIELGEHELREDLRAKLAGAVALERVFGEQLDCMLLFSSAASLLPSPLLGGYTAANAFLDGFAARARAAGRPVCAVAWGLFGEGGMARKHAATRGRLDAFAQLDPDAAFATLDRILAAELAQIGVLALDWPTWLQAHPQLAASPYFEAFLSTAPPDESPEVSDAVVPSPSDPASRRAWLDAYLRRQLARVLRLPEPTQIDEHAPLTSLGLDSLMALELRNRVEAETGAAPAVVELLRGISLTRLIELVDAQLAAPPPEPEWEELLL
jgi:myxalamid-type polyketide synthase MxaE and MxaD